MIGLGQPKTPHRLACGKPGQILLTLLFRTISKNRIHNEAGLNAHHGSITRIHPLYLPRSESIANVVQSSTAVAVNGGTEQPKLTHAGKERAIDFLLAERLEHPGLQVLLAEAPDRIAHQPFLIRQHVVQHQRICPIKSSGRLCGFGHYFSTPVLPAGEVISGCKNPRTVSKQPDAFNQYSNPNIRLV